MYSTILGIDVAKRVPVAGEWMRESGPCWCLDKIPVGERRSERGSPSTSCSHSKSPEVMGTGLSIAAFGRAMGFSSSDCRVG